MNETPVLWGDTHHPALSETKGDYDGQFLFIGDKANARLAVIDLRDWETKQIVKNPLTISDHGAAFVTPDTDYIIEGGQYATVLGYGYAPPEEYKKSYRGMVTMWKFDRAKGRIDETASFAIDLAAKKAWKGGDEVRLTPTEWHLVEAVTRRPGVLVPAQSLLAEVWGPRYEKETNYLRVYFAQLRRKLEDDPGNPRHFITEPGLGYRFEP